jgi:methylated-DNA-protein-cysteine methyltransferase related protein
MRASIRSRAGSRRATDTTDREHVARLYATIYAVVRRIPAGRVATYGQVAELAGIPGGARVAGAAMKTSLPSHRLPWQRVIGKASKLRGRIAIHDPVGAAVQRQLLEDEGVTVGDTGLVALDVFGWLPATAAAPRGAGRAGRRRPAAAGRRRRAGRSRTQRSRR